LADEREYVAARDLPNNAMGDPDAGSPIEGILVLTLPEARYQVRCFDPASGQYVAAFDVQGGTQTRIELPSFVHDLAVRITLHDGGT
jgi:hypothetical protein